jgi:Spy/CpxP family protein refolding chaperone
MTTMNATSTGVRHRLAARTVIAALALSVLFMTGHVFGQGTSGTLPGPISSHDLAGWSDQLDLSDEQRQAIDPFHEEYREAFRQLRDGEIEQYLQELGGMMGRGFRGLDKEAIQDSLRKLDRLMTRISLLDEGLFSNMQSVLSDEQVAQLPRVMQARKRERFQTGASRMGGSMNRAARVDMSDLYYGLELTPDQRQATDPLVVQYEDRLTAATEDLYEASTRMFLVVVEALEDAGISFDTMREGGPPPADMMNAMRNAWTEANEKPREKAAAISDLNNQTLRRLTEFLPRDAASTLRDRYLGRAYPEVPRASQSEALKSFHAALRLPSLSPDLRADITAMAVQFRGSADQVVDEMIKAVDEYRNNAAPFGRGRDRSQRREYNQKLEGYRERLAGLDRTAVEAIEGLLGPDLSQSVKIAAADTTFEDETSEPAGRDRRRPGSSVEEATDAFIAGIGPDPFLPSPITSRDVALYTKRLKLDDNDRFIMKSLHQEYVSAFGQLKRTDIATLRAALAAARPAREERRQEGPRRGEENARPTGPTAQQVDEIYDLRSSALKSIQTLDGTFFDDIETLIAAPEQAALVQRLRTARERSVYNRGLEANPFDAMFGGRGGRHGRGGPRGPDMGGQSNESGVDLSYLVERLDLGADQRTEMDKLLADYEANALDGFRRQYESVLKLRREIERLRAQRAQGDGNRRERDREAMQSRWENFRRLQENEGRKATDDRKFMVDLNRATLAVLTEALPEEAAANLDRAYSHAAFPSIYSDPDSADRYLTTALQLRDLDESQRDGIDAIIAEYRPAHEKVADQIAEIHAARADEGNDFDRERWRTYQEQRNRIEVLDFERQEINAKALRRLREVLTDEQVERLRLPSEVARNAGDDGRSG